MILLDFLGLKNELLAIYTLQCFAIALIWKMVHRIVQHCIMKLSALHRSTPYTWITFYNITLQCIAMPFAQDVGPVLYETGSIALNCTLIPCSRLQSIACYCNAKDVGYMKLSALHCSTPYIDCNALHAIAMPKTWAVRPLGHGSCQPPHHQPRPTQGTSC